MIEWILCGAYIYIFARAWHHQLVLERGGRGWVSGVASPRSGTDGSLSKSPAASVRDREGGGGRTRGEKPGPQSPPSASVRFLGGGEARTRRPGGSMRLAGGRSQRKHDHQAAWEEAEKEVRGSGDAVKRHLRRVKLSSWG